MLSTGWVIQDSWQDGPTASTPDFTPSVGVMDDHKNVYYGIGYNEGATQFGRCFFLFKIMNSGFGIGVCF